MVLYGSFVTRTAKVATQHHLGVVNNNKVYGRVYDTGEPEEGEKGEGNLGWGWEILGHPTLCMKSSTPTTCYAYVMQVDIVNSNQFCCTTATIVIDTYIYM